MQNYIFQQVFYEVLLLAKGLHRSLHKQLQKRLSHNELQQYHIQKVFREVLQQAL